MKLSQFAPSILVSGTLLAVPAHAQISVYDAHSGLISLVPMPAASILEGGFKLLSATIQCEKDVPSSAYVAADVDFRDEGSLKSPVFRYRINPADPNSNKVETLAAYPDPALKPDDLERLKRSVEVFNQNATQLCQQATHPPVPPQLQIPAPHVPRGSERDAQRPKLAGAFASRGRWISSHASLIAGS